jgi:uncharacterized protein YndB with AHSA1/START domain
MEFTVSTSLPTEDVWDYLADLTHAPQWDPGTSHAVRTGESRFDLRFKRWPSVVMHYTLDTTASSRGHRLVFKTANDSGTITTHESFTLAPHPATPGSPPGSVVRYELRLSILGGCCAPCFSALLVRQLKADSTVAGKQLQTTLENMSRGLSV